MKLNILLSFIFIYIIINTVNAKELKLSKRAVKDIKEKKKCKVLNNEYIKIKHYTYSFLNRYSVVFAKDFYLEVDDEIVICNDNYYYNYIFYLQQNAYKESYGVDSLGGSCKHNNTQIEKWDFYNDKGKSLIFKENNKDNQGNVFTLQSSDTKFNENDKYTFHFVFKNKCVYDIPIRRVQYVKSFKKYICNKEKEEEVKA